MAKRGAGLREQVRRSKGNELDSELEKAFDVNERKKGSTADVVAVDANNFLWDSALRPRRALLPVSSCAPVTQRDSASLSPARPLKTRRSLPSFPRSFAIASFSNRSIKTHDDIDDDDKTLSTTQRQDLATLDVTKLTPLSPEVISRQATINIGTKEVELKRAEGTETTFARRRPNALSDSTSASSSPNLSKTHRNHRPRRPRQVHRRQGNFRSPNGQVQERARAKHHHQVGLCECKNLQSRGPFVPEAPML